VTKSREAERQQNAGDDRQEVVQGPRTVQRVTQGLNCSSF
jgi:hypothetical protein